jgi:nitroreductase
LRAGFAAISCARTDRVSTRRGQKKSMNSVSPENLIAQLNWRYATKKFDSTRTIPADVMQALEQSLVLAPSSFGLQPWKFLVVTNPAVRKELVPHSWGQTQPADCSHFVVLAAQRSMTGADVERYFNRLIEQRGTPKEMLAAYRGMMEGFIESSNKAGMIGHWAELQVYIALGQLMASAAMLGVDACPMEGIVPKEYDRILGLTGTNHGALVACALGYRSPADRYATMAKVRYPATDLVQHI